LEKYSAHPESSNYGNHYSAEEVRDLFAPAKDTVDATRNWLEAAGIHVDRISVSANKQWLQFDATTSEAEELLKTKYHIYEHVGGKSTIGCDEYSIPEHVRPHIDYVTPGIKLYATGVKKAAPGDIAKRATRGPPKLPPILGTILSDILSLLEMPLLELCQIAITPECISTLYNITKADKSAPGNELGIFEDLGDVYDQTDLNLFFLTLQPDIPLGSHPLLKAIDGATAPNSLLKAGVESLLDFQISYPIIYPQTHILFQTDDPVYEANYTYEGFLNNFLDAIDGSYC
jgi:tripeptidyl-peptidase-1